MDRALVGGPAWHALGPEAWAQFSRRADLGVGLVAYPVEAIGATLLLIAALVSSRLGSNHEHRVTPPLVVAVIFSLLGLLLTAKAAPIMLSLGVERPAADLQRAFEIFSCGVFICGELSTCWRLLPRFGHSPTCAASLNQMRSRLFRDTISLETESAGVNALIKRQETSRVRRWPCMRVLTIHDGVHHMKSQRTRPP